MKFINKQTNFRSNKSPYPTYINSYVRDGKIEIGENSEYLLISYLFCHEINGKEVVISRSSLKFTDLHTPTTINDSNNEETEVYAAIIAGEIYDKSKIVTWGKPDLHRAMKMFKLDTLTNSETGIELSEFTEISSGGVVHTLTTAQSNQIKQLIIDWLEKNVIIENETLGTNFTIDNT